MIVETKPQLPELPKKEIGPHVARAIELRNRLNEATDRLNIVLLSAEAALVSLNLGVRAELNLPQKDWGTFADQLVYGKLNDKWGLFFVSKQDSGGDDCTPITNAPRRWRLLLPDLFDDMLEAMVASASSEIERVQRSSEKVKLFLDKHKEQP